MKYLTITYDVTGMSDEEIGGLEMEAAVQGESSEHHPEATVVGSWVTERQPYAEEAESR